ncbi:MAG: Methionyl-tRNA formyltransferase [Phylliscum demangeonii]|nr:MAG: Methionyl-tRNA formyltransferase [Phylliscum demangeonii]
MHLGAPPLSVTALRCISSLCARPFRQCTNRRYNSNAACDPLRVLFCGSDEFSAASLRALHEEHGRHPDLIASIDVVCRPAKRMGRGMKSIREVPLKGVAKELELSIHEVDNFTDWQLPTLPHGPVNLIVAVSFGLLVPGRIVRSATYGGLNVHPSLLPEFRGAAPLHHTLLAGRTKTGVTLQTLHPEYFDHGRILAQTPRPGLDIPDADHCTVPQLSAFLAPKAADMLVWAIREKLFLRPRAAHENPAEGEAVEASWAPKITTEQRQIDWRTWTARDIVRRERVLGPLWNMATPCAAVGASNVSPSKRVIWQGLEEVPAGDAPSLAPGRPFLHRDGEGASLVVWTQDGRLLRIPTIKLESRQTMEAVRAAKKANLLQVVGEEEGSLWRFCHPLK